MMFKLITTVLACILSVINSAYAEIPPDLYVIDTHNDLPYNFRRLIENNLDKYNFTQNLTTDSIFGTTCEYCYTDLPNLVKGKIGAQFWVAYSDCASQYRDSVEITLEQIDVIKRFVKKYPAYLQYATSVGEIIEARKANKIASLIAIEGGHSIGSRLGVLRMMYELGARYLTLTHVCETPWADSSVVDTSKPVHNLTNFGKSIIKEMNRLGMIVDVSHVSYNVMNEAIKTSRAPVIFSHSSAWSRTKHHRNVHDDTLKLLKENNGIIMINFYSGFVSSTPKNATLEDVAGHINYVVDQIGIDYVGLGADYDGVQVMPKGLENTSKYPDLLNYLQIKNATRWTVESLQNIAANNFLRVFKAIEDKRDQLTSENPAQDWIPKEDLLQTDQVALIKQCTTIFGNTPFLNKANNLLGGKELVLASFILLYYFIQLKHP